MHKPIIITIAIVLALMNFAGCGKKPSGDDVVIAKISNRFLTLKEFNAKMSNVPSYYQNVIEKNKRKYLDDIIAEMLLYEEAVRKGIDRDREVLEVASEAKKKIVVAKFIKNEVDSKVKVSDDEARQFYEAHKNEFMSPELWRASHILVTTDREARDVLDKLAQGASFEELAKTHSIDATSSRAGDIGYFRLGQLVPEFEKACLKLKVGETSGIVQTQFGYHIIRLTDKKESAVEGYEKVKNIIESELRRKKQNELLDKLMLGLRDKYNVEIKEDVLKSLDAKEEKASK